MTDGIPDYDAAARPAGSGWPACLILHGLGGGPYELEPLIAALRAQGIVHRVPVLPGHDGPGPSMPASRWTDWAAAAEAEFQALEQESPRVAMIGFSTGATLALKLAARLRVDRLVLLAPFLAIRYAGLIRFPAVSWLRPLACLIPALPRRPPAVRDPRMRRWAADCGRFKTFNLHAAVSALELIEDVKGLVPSIRAPALIIQGSRDTVVEPRGAAWLYQHLGSREKRWIDLVRSDHLVALDLERERVVASILEFLRCPTPEPEAT